MEFEEGQFEKEAFKRACEHPYGVRAFISDLEAHIYQLAMERSGGHKTKAARYLKIKRTTFSVRFKNFVAMGFNFFEK